MMERGDVRGLSVAVVTPMTPGGAVNFPALQDHVQWLLDGEVDVLMPCGTTGEGVTLDPQEHARVVATCVETAGGRTRVFAGAGASRTETAKALARSAREAGADGLLTATPAYNKPSQEGLRRHFTEVAEAGGGLPLVLYNVPGRTAVNLLPDTAFRLAEELEPVVAIKEASGDMQQVMTIMRDRPDGFQVLAGDDFLTVPFLALGGDGVVSVAANEAPADMRRMVWAALEGRFDEARELHERLLPVMRANFIETNPVPVKTALQMMGRMEAHVRLPLAPLVPESERRLREALVSAGLIPGEG